MIEGIRRLTEKSSNRRAVIFFCSTAIMSPARLGYAVAQLLFVRNPEYFSGKICLDSREVLSCVTISFSTNLNINLGLD